MLMVSKLKQKYTVYYDLQGQIRIIFRFKTSVGFIISGVLKLTACNSKTAVKNKEAKIAGTKTGRHYCIESEKLYPRVMISKK